MILTKLHLKNSNFKKDLSFDKAASLTQHYLISHQSLRGLQVHSGLKQTHIDRYNVSLTASCRGQMWTYQNPELLQKCLSCPAALRTFTRMKCPSDAVWVKLRRQNNTETLVHFMSAQHGSHNKHLCSGSAAVS